VSIRTLPTTGHEPCLTHPERWDALVGSQDGLQAKDLCRTRCPIVNECREWALENHEYVGVWGGTDADERKEIRRQSRRAA
jgi:hypothetical protein